MHNRTNKRDGVGHGSAFIQKFETGKKKEKEKEERKAQHISPSRAPYPFHDVTRSVFIKCLSAHVSFLFHFSPPPPSPPPQSCLMGTDVEKASTNDKKTKEEWVLLMGLFSAAALTSLFDFPGPKWSCQPMCPQALCLGCLKELCFLAPAHNKC